VALTRGSLLTGVSGLVIDHPKAPPKVYVDDTAQLSEGTAKDAMQTMYLSLLNFVEEVKALQLTLSTKGVIIAKVQKHAYVLAKVLADQGIVYQVKNNTRDVGVGFSFGNTSQQRTLLKK